MKMTISGISAQAESQLTFTTVLPGGDALRLLSGARVPESKVRRRDIESFAANAVWANATIGPISIQYSGKYKLDVKQRQLSRITLAGKPYDVNVIEGNTCVAILECLQRCSETSLKELSVVIIFSFTEVFSEVLSEESLRNRGKSMAKEPPELHLSSQLASPNSAFVSPQSPFALSATHIGAMQEFGSPAHIDAFLLLYRECRPELALLYASDSNSVAQRKREYFSTQPAFIVAAFEFYSALSIHPEKRAYFHEWLMSLELRRAPSSADTPEWARNLSGHDGLFPNTWRAAKEIVKNLEVLFEVSMAEKMNKERQR